MAESADTPAPAVGVVPWSRVRMTVSDREAGLEGEWGSFGQTSRRPPLILKWEKLEPKAQRDT